MSNERARRQGQRMQEAVSQSEKGPCTVGWTESLWKVTLEDGLIIDGRGDMRVRKLWQNRTRGHDDLHQTRQGRSGERGSDLQ